MKFSDPHLISVICPDCKRSAEYSYQLMVWYCTGCGREITQEEVFMHFSRRNDFEQN